MQHSKLFQNHATTNSFLYKVQPIIHKTNEAGSIYTHREGRLEGWQIVY